MIDRHLADDREHLNSQQRARRSGMRRIDYMPSGEALAVIEVKRATCRPGSVAATNSAIIDVIVTEWATQTGIKYRRVEAPMSSGKRPELSHHYARVYDFDGRLAEMEATARGICGAKTRNGHPCRAKSEPGKRRCKWHGGCSTGPRTPEGRARALANLRQNQTA
jgi:hypothetical protein